MVWSEILLSVLLAIPVLIIAGVALVLAVGGVLGCAECALDWLGMRRFTPAIVLHRHGTAARAH